MRCKGGVWELLFMLGIGLNRNAPVAILKPMLCNVSIVFRWEGLAFMKRNEPYSNLDSIIDLYNCIRVVEFPPQNVWPKTLSMLIIVENVFPSSLRWAI